MRYDFLWFGSMAVAMTAALSAAGAVSWTDELEPADEISRKGLEEQLTVLVSAYFRCIKDAVVAHVAESEDAGFIMDASVDGCAPQLQSLAEDSRRLGLPDERIDELVETARKNGPVIARVTLVQYVIEHNRSGSASP